MQKPDHSYLDLSVLPEIRSLVVSGDAAVLFRNDLSEIIWANAYGARLFGGHGVADLLGEQIPSDLNIIKQLRSTIGQMKKKKPIVRGFRINQGQRSILLEFEIVKTPLPDDQPGFLVRNISNEEQESSEHDLCKNAIDALEGFADAAAILDDFGLPIASSPKFGDLCPDEKTLERFLYELSGEHDRLIKRPVTSNSGNILATGLARLSDTPGRHLIVIADTQEKAEVTDDDSDTSDINFEPDDAHSDPDTDNDEKSDDLTDETENFVSQAPETSSQDSQLETDTSYVSEVVQTKDIKSEASEKTDERTDELEANLTFPDIDKQISRPEENSSTDNFGEKFLYTNEQDDVRFSWSIDRDNVFQSVSIELSRTVGPNAADIIGRNWSELRKVFGFDSSGEIAERLERQDTWSGKTVLWPVQGTDMSIPVDLAALPVFGSDRTFEGFKGFGIIRTVDAMIDPEAIGLALVGISQDQEDDTELSIEPDQIEASENEEIQLGLTQDDETEVFAPIENTSSPELSLVQQEKPNLEKSNIVRLVPKRNIDDASELSEKENTAFQVIGEKLRDDSQEKKPKDEASKEKPQHLDTSLMENLPVAILVYRTDELLFANQKMLSATGYENINEISAAGGIEALLNGQDTLDEDANGYQYLITKTGTKIGIEPVLQTVPWQGERALLLSFSTKPEVIIEENLALEITASSEIQNILDTASDGIIVMETDGTIISVNASAEALFSTSFDDASGTKFIELFAPESQEIIEEYIISLASPGVDRLLNDGRDVIAQEQNGGLIPIFLTLSQMESSNKICAVVRDMTSWKKVEEELIQSRRDAIKASEQKTDFLAHISHEIRTPLNAIIGFSDVMLEEKFGPVDNQRYREYLRDINRSGSHVLELVNDLLDLSKIEAGKLELSFEAVELNQIVAETVALLQPQANSNRIIIRTSLSRAVPKVVADPRTIRQIILNLVSNAIKFSPANSQVIVSTLYEANGEVALRVRDTGHGMSEHEIEEAMKPFHQLHSVSERAGEGTGLGLPLTKALVEANRALFDLESEPGTGTIAHVHFPNQRVLSD